MANLSILGLYNYDPTIFSGLTIPTADDITDEAEKVTDPFVPDKTTLINYICMQLAEMELVYTKPEVVKTMIGIWSSVRLPVWKAIYNTLLYKYNPIWNKDGEIIEDHDLTIEDDYNVTNLKTEHDGNVANEVTGYDSATYSPNTRQVVDTSDTQNGNTNNVHTDTGTITRTEHGNIGVTMTQEMIRQQREVVEFNLYDYILQDFKAQFCVAVW